MKKRIVWCFLVVLLLLCPFTAVADLGPKPSVVITFENMADGTCYGTLLSQTASTGPHSAWDGVEGHERNRQSQMGVSEEAWRKFLTYSDPDGYYFLQWGARCDEDKRLAWTYYPPQSFKVLLYFPQEDRFAVSGICERYAFDSYFTVDVATMTTTAGEPDSGGEEPLLPVKKSYDFRAELLSFLARVVLTVALELLIALPFGYRARASFGRIALVNVITQILLNVLLNVIHFYRGFSSFVFWYILLEIAVFVLEAVLYSRLLPHHSKRRTWLYALVANAASFGLGLMIARFIPTLF